MVAAGSWSERIDAMCTRDSGCRVGVNSGGREHLQCGPCAPAFCASGFRTGVAGPRVRQPLRRLLEREAKERLGV